MKLNFFELYLLTEIFDEKRMRKGARMTVLDDDESPDLSRYEIREGEDEQKPLNFTLMRRMERFYKQNKDLSGAIDLLNLNDETRKKIEKVVFKKSDNTDLIAHKIIECPGLYIIQKYLSKETQNELISNTFIDECNLKNRNSLTSVYNLPKTETFYSLIEKNGFDHVLDLSRQDDPTVVKSLSIENWLRKIRWINLGLFYDWTTKSYDFDSERLPFPFIQNLCRQVSAEIGMKMEPEAGIINFYQLKDTLTAHIDRSEKDMTLPLISFSVGNSCVYLMGGKKRDDPVIPIIINSGDALIMAHPCRRNFHGVPKILDYCVENFDQHQFGSVIKNSRININARQVF
jgi:DNA alkylation damage repair protein AlkB